MTLFSIAPTEVKIERDFSCLKRILTDQRYNLSQEQLEAILLIHLNKEVFYKVRDEQLANLRQ